MMACLTRCMLESCLAISLLMLATVLYRMCVCGSKPLAPDVKANVASTLRLAEEGPTAVAIALLKLLSTLEHMSDASQPYNAAGSMLHLMMVSLSLCEMGMYPSLRTDLMALRMRLVNVTPFEALVRLR